MTGPDRLFLEFQLALAGRYSIERELGRGGMGIVYLAREVRLDRPVALKLLPPHLAGRAPLRERFLREARTAAKLSHPNIIPIHAVDEAGGFVFIAMAYVQGQTITERVNTRGPLPASEAARMLREVAWALGYAHAQGVIHRDVKPDNIILETGTGRALVADFGIAGEIKDAAALDGGEVLGTPEFMSPEQALGEGVDARSDLYALGAVGYFAVSGRLPFTAAKATEVLAKQVTATAPPLTGIVDGMPRKLTRAIERCLAKDRAERPESAAALADELGLALEHKKELPVALRVFVKRNARLGGIGGLLYVTMGLPFLSSLFIGLAPVGSKGLAALAGALTGIIVVPFGILVGRARRLLAAGFGPEDLGYAFRAELEQGREERVYEYGRDASLFERVVRLLFLGGAATALLSGVVLSTTTWQARQAMYGGLLDAVFGISMLTTMGGGVLWVNRLNRRIDLDTRIWSRLWQSPVGRLMFRLARPFVSRKGLPAPQTHRATELALGLAAERLFEELPRETRRELTGLPAGLRRLEGAAGRMRSRLEQLNDALGDAETGTGAATEAIAERRDHVVTDLRRERELIQRRLRDTVAALETIRLNLLKLQAGTGSVQSLTTDLSLARDAAREVDLLLQGHREIDEALEG